jgi:hypothetical protein
VTIGNSVTSIEGWTFDYCGSLNERDDPRERHQHWEEGLHSLQ